MEGQKDEVTVYYHHPCVDGWVSAVSAWQALGPRARYVGLAAGTSAAASLTPQDDMSRHTVYFLDVCPPRAALLAFLERGARVVILDHHESTLRRLPELEALRRSTGRLVAVVDQGMSGAMHAFAFFHPDDPAPLLVRYVDDRDRWNFSLPASREVSAMLSSYVIPAEGAPGEFSLWLGLAALLETEAGFEQLVAKGEAILRVQEAVIEKQLRRARTGGVLGHLVPLVNLTAYHSETLAALLDRHADAPFVAGYFDDAGERHWSLRTRPDRRTNVALLAERVGGGGHALAAGFEEPLPPSSHGPVVHDYEAKSA